MDEKALISILESNIGNKKSETKTETEKLVSDMPLTARETREKKTISETKKWKLNRKLKWKLVSDMSVNSWK